MPTRDRSIYKQSGEPFEASGTMYRIYFRYHKPGCTSEDVLHEISIMAAVLDAHKLEVPKLAEFVGRQFSALATDGVIELQLCAKKKDERDEIDFMQAMYCAALQFNARRAPGKIAFAPLAP